MMAPYSYAKILKIIFRMQGFVRGSIVSAIWGEPLAPDFMFTAFLVLLRSLFFVDMKIRLSSRWIIVLSIIVLLVIDQVVKVVVKTNMTLGEAIPVFGQWFFIRFIENDGAAYGMKLAEGPWGKMALSLIRIGLVGFISYYIHTLVKDRKSVV